MVPCVTAPKKPASRRRGGRGAGRRKPAEAAVPAAESPLDAFLEQPAPAVPVVEPQQPLPETTTPEPALAARVPPPAPPRPLPATRRAIFFDVENSSRVEHVARVLAHLQIDRIGRATELIAVGNWRVINHETARLLARHGGHLVHSAPSVGVRDWSDLRIAVTAGVWLASARPGDMVEIISDDQAFDAVGDVAGSLGVAFRRLSYRALAGIVGDVVVEEPAEPRSRRRRRGGRRGGRRESLPPAHTPAAVNGGEPAGEAHTAPHDELLAVARELLARSPERTVNLDALSNALKAHGFRRTPGSPRLITRLRRIKELEVSRSGIIRLVDAGLPEQVAESAAEPGYATTQDETGAAPHVEGQAVTEPAPARRRRRRRGGRGRRGRGGGHAPPPAP
jgi:hypothetical protein